jgi:hypothetical protein
MDTSPKASAAGYLRVSDADRDSALAELSEHFQAGRLTAGMHWTVDGADAIIALRRREASSTREAICN